MIKFYQTKLIVLNTIFDRAVLHFTDQAASAMGGQSGGMMQQGSASGGATSFGQNGGSSFAGGQTAGFNNMAGRSMGRGTK